MNRRSTNAQGIVTFLLACATLTWSQPTPGDDTKGVQGPRFSASLTHVTLDNTGATESEYEHIFTFRNAGSEDLQIEGVKTNCGCVYELVSNRVIPPGGEGTLVVRVVDTKLNVSSARVVLLTNDPDASSVQFTVDIERPATSLVLPESLDLGTVQPTEAIMTSFKVRRTTGQLTPYTVKPAQERLRVKHAGIEHDDGGVWDIFAVAGKAPYHAESVIERFEVSRNGIPIAEVPVSASIERAVSAVPSRVLFGVVALGEERSVRVELTGKPEHMADLLASIDDPRFSAEIDPASSDSIRNVLVEFRAEFAGVVESNLNLTTPEGKLVQVVPLYARVRPASDH